MLKATLKRTISHGNLKKPVALILTLLLAAQIFTVGLPGMDFGAGAEVYASSGDGHVPNRTITWSGHTYEYYSDAISWEEAYQFCEGKGGHLATLRSAEEQNAVYSMVSDLPDHNLWVGMIRASDGEYV